MGISSVGVHDPFGFRLKVIARDPQFAHHILDIRYGALSGDKSFVQAFARLARLVI